MAARCEVQWPGAVTGGRFVTRAVGCQGGGDGGSGGCGGTGQPARDAVGATVDVVVGATVDELVGATVGGTDGAGGGAMEVVDDDEFVPTVAAVFDIRG